MVLHLMMIHETSCTKIIYNSLNPPDKYAAFGAAADDSRTISSKFDSVDARGVRATDGEEREAFVVSFVVLVRFVGGWRVFKEFYDWVGAATGDGKEERV